MKITASLAHWGWNFSMARGSSWKAGVDMHSNITVQASMNDVMMMTTIRLLLLFTNTAHGVSLWGLNRHRDGIIWHMITR